MEPQSRKSALRAALAITFASFLASAAIIHVCYVDMDADRIADGFMLPRSSLALAVGPAAAVLYFALIDAMFPLGSGKIHAVMAAVRRVRGR